MSAANSTRRTRARKPATKRKPLGPKPEKPPGSPLTVQNCGYFSKKVRGKVYYFGTWAAGHDAALAEWNERKDDILAGRTPKPDREPITGTLKELVNEYTNYKRRKYKEGAITQHTFEDCKRVCAFIVKHLDRGRLISDLRPDDFMKLSQALGKQTRKGREKSLVVLANWIGRIRQVFTWGVKAGKIDHLPAYGLEFEAPRGVKVQEQKQDRIEEHGQRLFSRQEILAMLLFASGSMESMILLGVNCGLGNSDLGKMRLKHLDLETGWLDYRRPKNQRRRKCKLWPETVAALKAWLTIRPEPKDAEHDQLVYLTKRGGPWAKGPGDNPLSHETGKLLTRLGINGERGFYTLRHTFRTIAGNSKDPEAIYFTMGHALPGMARDYVENVSEDRLQAVAECVRSWLFGAKEAK